MITVTPAAVGSAARHALGLELRSLKADDPLTPVTILVPTNYVGVSTRRQLAAGIIGPVSPAGSGIAGISLLTLYRLADLLGAPALARSGRRPVSTPIVGAAVRIALARMPDLFGPATEHPATEQALVPLYRELRDLAPDQIERLAAASARAARVVELYRSVTGILQDDWYDEFDLLSEARRHVATEPATVERQFGAFILYLPASLTTAQTQLVTQLGQHLDVRCIVGMTGDHDADRSIHRLVRQLGAEVPQLDSPPPTAHDIIIASDPDEEVRAVLRQVTSDLVDGITPEHIAVLFPDPTPYARIAHEQFGAAGIPFNGEPIGSIGRSLVGRTLLGLVELAESGLTPDAVIDWLAGALIRHQAGQPRSVPVGAWQPVFDATRTAGSGDQWHRRLEQHRSSLELELEHIEGVPDLDGAAGHIRRELRHTGDVIDFLAELSDELGAAQELTTWTSMVGWAQHLVDRYVQPDEDLWPQPEMEAVQAVERCLDRLRSLDLIEGPINLHLFGRTLDSELSQPLSRAGRVGNGVFIGRIGQAEGMSLERLYILGMHEGAAPSPPTVDSVLGDRERAGLDGALSVHQGAVEDQHRRFLTSLAACNGRRVLLQPRGSLRRTTEYLPSRWLLDAASTLHGEPVNVDLLRQLASADHTPSSPAWLVDVASFTAGIRSCRHPATETDDHLTELIEHSDAGHDPRTHRLAGTIPSLGRSLEAVASRHGDGFSRFDGNLRGLVDEADLGLAVLDATRLETWMACPHRYFLSYVLGVRGNREARGELELPPTVKGFIVHQTLDRFCRELLEDSDLAIDTSTDQWRFGPAARQRLLELATDLTDEAEQNGLAGIPLLWDRDRERLMNDFLVFPDHDESRSWRGVLRGSELSFGTPNRHDSAVQRILPGGRVVQFKGTIDRLEQRSDGSLVVLDYKTGAPTGYAEVRPDNPIADGTRLQLPIYALAGRALLGAPEALVHAAYWFVSSRPGGWAMTSIDIDDDVLGHFDAAVEHIVSSIEQGLFPHKPVPPHRRAWAGCPSCNPAGLHVAEFIEGWQRKWGDDELTLLAWEREPTIGDVGEDDAADE